MEWMEGKARSITNRCSSLPGRIRHESVQVNPTPGKFSKNLKSNLTKMNNQRSTLNHHVDMSTENHMPKDSSSSSKKHKSSHSEKKRKRPNEEDPTAQKKSKKHRSEKDHQTVAPVAQNASPSSPFHLQTASLYLPLAPISQRYPLEGLCAEHVSPLILTYYPPLRGVILSYSNPRISTEPLQDSDPKGALLKTIDEYAVSWAWVTADFLLFKPERDAWLEGYVNLQNEGHLGIVCWNLFNASIERARLPKDWKWIGVEGDAGNENGSIVNGDNSTSGARYAEDGIGYYVDGEGKKIEETIRFRIKDMESSHDRERGFLSIAGTMLDEEEEAQLIQRERANSKNLKQTAGRRLGGMGALGATFLGTPRDPDEEGTNPNRKRY